jgi:hypothetical protein
VISATGRVHDSIVGGVKLPEIATECRCLQVLHLTICPPLCLLRHKSAEAPGLSQKSMVIA